MILLRSILFNMFFFGWTAITLVVMTLALPFPRAVTCALANVWGGGISVALRSLVGIIHEIRGRENIPEGGAIIASKHQSVWETGVFFALSGDPVYVLKKELLRIPFWGWCARKAGALVVDRHGGGAALKQLVRDSRAALDRGSQVVIFPEGTRTPPGQSQLYHPGVFAVHNATKAPVIPVALNSGLYWGRRSIIKRPGVIILEFLPALPPGLSRRAFMAELETRIESESKRLAAEGGWTENGDRL